MISHAWTVICDKSIIDRETNNISLYVLEEISIISPPREPGAIIQVAIQISIVSLWYRTDHDQPARSQTRISLISPDKTTIASMDSEIDLDTYYRARTIGIINGLPVEESGRYYFRVELLKNEQWEQVACVPLQVIIVPEGQEPST